MAKNNTMAAKHAMAKKWAMKEVLDNAKAEMCANANVTTQAKINRIMGYFYPEEQFANDYRELYVYICSHNLSEIKKYIQQNIKRR